jgi:hypothetical protein
LSTGFHAPPVYETFMFPDRSGPLLEPKPAVLNVAVVPLVFVTVVELIAGAVPPVLPVTVKSKPFKSMM